MIDNLFGYFDIENTWREKLYLKPIKIDLYSNLTLSISIKQDKLIISF